MHINQVRAKLKADAPAGVQAYLTGRDPLYEASTGGSSGGPSVLTEALIGGLGCLVILFFVFGTLPAVLMPIVVAIAAILNTFTLVWILTYITNVSIIVQFLIALVGLGVAIDYALLMIFRFRDELREGEDVETALVETMTHAGRSVIVSGSTVAVGLLSMLVLPLPFIRSIGIGGMLIPTVSVITAITLLPALLATLGPRINSVRLLPKRFVDRGHPEDGPWGRWARFVMRHPGPVATVGLAIVARARLLRRAAEPERGAGEGLPRQGRRDQRPPGARRRAHLAGRDEAVRRARREQRRPAGDRGQGPAGAGHRRRRRAAGLAQGLGQPRRGLPRRRRRGQVHARRRSRTFARELKGTDGTLGGVAGEDRDFVAAVYSNFPYVLAFVVLLTFILLARAFRSILLPIKAVVLNLISLLAAYGIIVFIFQEGHGSEAIWGVPRPTRSSRGSR